MACGFSGHKHRRASAGGQRIIPHEIPLSDKERRYARDEQLGKAVRRLDDLYAKSIAAQDTRTALQAQRELNRLLSLYSAADSDKTQSGESDDGDEAARRLALVASYLLPLRLTDEKYPVEEYARLAAEELRGTLALA